ncbi:hypothetical protein [Actinoallomurus acaciae]|uniref:Uncharacterized protein n=1 Tax=Actinoallomurus acaciae TaxID=502577 RepID=A0ABV5Z0M2_9ACTN
MPGAIRRYEHDQPGDLIHPACTEIPADERKETAAASWRRAHAHFTGCGITIAS